MSLKLNISDIGIIKQANIDIRGLTVIAGYNGTGKSTVGKVLFSCIGGVKSLLNREQSIISDNLDRYITQVDYNINVLSGILTSISKNEKIDFTPFRGSASIKAFINTEDNSLVIDGKLIMPYSYYCSFKSQNQIYNEMINQIKKEVPQLDIRRVRKPLRDISLALEQISAMNNRFSSNGMTDRIELSFNNEFFGSIVSYGQSTGEVVLSRDSELLLSVSFHNLDKYAIPGHIISVEEYEVLINSTEGTFIDNTLYIDDYPLLSKGSLYNDFKMKGLRREYYRDSLVPIQLHKWDLLKKINYSLRLNNYSSSDNSELTNLITAINEGCFKPDGVGGVNFYDVDGQKILPINVACGNKLLGMLHLLIQSNAISKNSFIVIDEPENNLHPSKQVELAKIFIKMVSLEYNLLITTHSPYMLQALKTYAELEGIFENKTNFYFSERNEDTSSYNIRSAVDSDGNFDDSEIFKSLYNPIEELMKIDEDISHKAEEEFLS